MVSRVLGMSLVRVLVIGVLLGLRGWNKFDKMVRSSPAHKGS